MEKILEVTLLYDFYGELLTDKQNKICTLYYLDDYSLGEISEVLSISRQGVYDALKRSEKQLYHYEEKLGLVKRMMSERQIVEKILQVADCTDIEKQEEVMSNLKLIKTYAASILEQN